jgi:hypothetical protein
MGKLISLLIDRSQQLLMGFLLWLGVFALTLVVAVGLASFQINQTMMDEARLALIPQIQLCNTIASTVAAMRRQVTAEPCSEMFHEQLREIAYLPDGLN